MKKFLLTLIVTMLTCIGAWADETPLIDAGPDGATGLSAFQMSSQEVKNLNLKVGDVLKLYWKATTNGYASVSFLPTGEYTEIFGVNTNNDGIYTDWTVKEFELTENQITSLEKGFSATWEQNITLQKLTLIHYDAPESVSLNESSITLGIGSTYNLLKATVNPSTANQTVDWSVVSGGESIVSVNANGVITGLAAGDAYVRATVPGTSYYADCFVKVQKGFSLSLAADKTTVLNTVGGTVNITPTVSLDGENPVEGEDYDIDYSIRNNADPTHVTIDGKVLTIAAGAAAGTYTIDAELDSKTADYAGARASIDIVVDAPVENAIHLTIGDQTFGKSDGAKGVSGGLTIDKSIFDNQYTVFTFNAESDNNDVVTASWGSSVNQHNNTVTFTINGAGTAHVTLTVDAVNPEGKVTTTTKTITVNVVGDQLKFTMDNLTVNDDQALTLDAILAAINKVYTGADDNPTIVTSGYEVEVMYNDAKVETSIPAQGSGVNSFDITVNVKATDLNYSDADSKVVPVTVTHLQSFALDLTADKTSIMDNGQKATITPAATFNGSDVEISSYTVSSNNPDVATVVKNADNTITVTGKNVGTVTVTVTATPTDNTTYAAVTNSIDINVVAGPRVSLSKQTIDGKEYVVVNVPAGGAFGGISDTPKYTSTDDTTIEMLKAAANVKVTGSISNSDVQELVYLIGGVVADEGNCETLDMGEARMTEAITDINVGTESQPVYKCSLIGGTKPDGYTCEKTMLNASKIVFPQPAIGVEDGTVLPARRNSLFTAWYTNSTNDLETLVIPEGWTKLADMPVERSTFLKLTSLQLPNSLVYIGDYAFESLHTPVLTIPPYVQHIGKEAFSSSQPGDVSDVYFTGKTAPTFVDQWAFSSAAQMANNTFENKDVVGGKTDRNALQVGGKLLCIMHYPAGCEAEYIDQTRKYYSTRGENDNSPSDARYKVEAWSEDEIATFISLTSEAHNVNQQVQFVPTGGMVDSGYEDFSFTDRIWPSQEIMTAAYSIAWIGYHWDGTPMTQAELDKRGLYQFVTFMSDSPEDQYDWDFKGYDNDKWYTIAVPFDMSVDQVKKVFGNDVQVCRFSKVTRKYEEGAEDNQIIFEFRNSVITNQAVMDVDADGNNIYSTGNKATYHASQPADEGSYAGFTGIVHNVPYMIKPKGQTDCPTRTEGGQLVRTFEGYKMKGEGMPFERITADGITYGFVGTNRSTPLKPGTYFLGRKNGSTLHKYYFYTGGEKQRTPNTAAILPSDGGVLDGSQFFGLNITPSDDNEDPETQASAAKYLVSIFGDDEDASTINNYTIVCGNDIIDNKVYTINGQLINSKNLPAGLYIKNGKKFIVK